MNINNEQRGEIQALDDNFLIIQQYNLTKKSTDGGVTWNTILTLPQTMGIGYCFNFPTREIGYVWNSNGPLLYKTTNSGNTWTSHDPGHGMAGFKIQFINAQTGFLCGYDSHGCISKTTNGGETFLRVLDVDSSAIYSLSFPTTTIGLAVVTNRANYQTLLYKTEDAGNSWAPIAVIGQFTPFYMNFTTSTQGIITGQSIAFSTTTQGNSWSTHTESSGLFGQAIISGNGFGYIPVRNDFSNSYLIKTTDYGISWVHDDTFPIASSYIVKTENYYFLSSHAWSSLGGIYRTNTLTSINGNNSVVKGFDLFQNYPNPFNPTTKINFSLPKDGLVSLKIYDIRGKEIQTLIDENKPAGYYSVEFNGRNLSSGIFFYRIEAGEFTETKKMSLIK